MDNKIFKNKKIIGKPNLNKKTKKFFGQPKINLIFNFARQRWEKLKTTVHREWLFKKKVNFFCVFCFPRPSWQP